MKQNSLVSIIVPIYRVEKYLEECVDSLIAQTLKDIEIILVDDGSDDGCARICDEYAKRDCRIRVIHKKNGGADSARKAGVSAATGKYIGYVDGDDWVDTNMYEKMVYYAEKYQVAVVETGIIDSWNSRERRRKSYLPEGCYKGDKFRSQVEQYILYAGSFFQHGVSPYLCSKIFLREAIYKYQSIDDILNKIQDDTMVSIPCIVEQKSLYISNDCFYHYRVRTNSGKREIRKNEVDNFKKFYPLMFDRLNGSLLGANEDNQINSYSMYWLLMKAPYVFMRKNNRFFLPIKQLTRGSRIVIYGAGSVGIHWKDSFDRGNINVLAWVDKNYKTISLTYDVSSPDTIMNIEFDYIVIAILREDAVESAKTDLIKMGVSEEKICWIDKEYINNPVLLLKEATYKGEKIF